ncbi:MAG: hypothetical protein AAFV88_09395 [Planctomycetota bacterium]
MLRKLFLAAAVVLGSVAATQSTADAGDCYGNRYRSAYRGPSYRVPAYRPPAYGYGYRAPVGYYGRPPVHGVNNFYGVSRYSSFRSPYIGPSVGFGYSSFSPYRRGGVSIGIGF